MRSKVFFLFLLTPWIANGQLVIKQESVLSSSKSQVALNCNFINRSILANLDACEFTLTGNNQLLQTSDFSVRGLVVQGSGVKTFQGNWEVTEKLSLQSGIVVPSQLGRITYTGKNSIEANENSYVRGQFFSKGPGQRFFPVGNVNGYFPAVLSNSPSLVGIEVISSYPAIQIPTESEGIVEIYNERYWKLTAGETSSGKSQIGLSLRGTQTFFPEGTSGLTVIEADQTQSPGRNLGQYSMNGSFVFSKEFSVASNIYTLGKTEEAFLKIHNVITPNSDGENDVLYIEYIAGYPDNTVVLMDRWGIVVKEWKSYQNETPNFNFSDLDPGNYICTLQYKSDSGTKKISQMVSLLK